MANLCGISNKASVLLSSQCHEITQKLGRPHIEAVDILLALFAYYPSNCKLACEILGKSFSEILITAVALLKRFDRETDPASLVLLTASGQAVLEDAMNFARIRECEQCMLADLFAASYQYVAFPGVNAFLDWSDSKIGDTVTKISAVFEDSVE